MALRTHSGLPLELQSLRATFAERGRAPREILDVRHLRLDGGAQVAICGPSGSGKTTLLHLVAALLRPRRGIIRWGDVEVTALTERIADRWRRETVGLVFQEFHLFPGLSALENVLLPLRFDRCSIEPASRSRALKLLDRVGVGPGEDVAALSRGEQQRVAVARALLRKPAIVLADEPTASLDRETANIVADLLSSMCRAAGATLLVTTHDAALAGRLDATYDVLDGDLRARSTAARSSIAAVRGVNPLPLVAAELRRNSLGCAAVITLIAIAVALGVASSAQERALALRDARVLSIGSTSFAPVQCTSSTASSAASMTCFVPWRLPSTALSSLQCCCVIVSVLSARRRSVGALRALGAPPGFIFVAVWLQGALLIAAGVVSGLPLGFVLGEDDERVRQRGARLPGRRYARYSRARPERWSFACGVVVRGGSFAAASSRSCCPLIAPAVAFHRRSGHDSDARCRRRTDLSPQGSTVACPCQRVRRPSSAVCACQPKLRDRALSLVGGNRRRRSVSPPMVRKGGLDKREFTVQRRCDGEAWPIPRRSERDQDLVHVVEELYRASDKLIRQPTKLAGPGKFPRLREDLSADVGLARQVRGHDAAGAECAQSAVARGSEVHD